MQVSIRVWHDGDAWVAEAMECPNAVLCGASRDEVVAGMHDLLLDLRDHGLLAGPAEVLTVDA